MEFPSEEEAVDYAIRTQFTRRNATDADIFRLVEMLDERKKRGNHAGNQYTGMEKPPDGGISRSASAKQTAAMIGISHRKVEKAGNQKSRGYDSPSSSYAFSSCSIRYLTGADLSRS